MEIITMCLSLTGKFCHGDNDPHPSSVCDCFLRCHHRPHRHRPLITISARTSKNKHLGCDDLLRWSCDLLYMAASWSFAYFKLSKVWVTQEVTWIIDMLTFVKSDIISWCSFFFFVSSEKENKQQGTRLFVTSSVCTFVFISFCPILPRYPILPIYFACVHLKTRNIKMLISMRAIFFLK